MRETFTVPEEDRFMVVTEHEEDGFFYSKSYFNIDRTDDLVIIQITVTNSRNVDQKKALFARFWWCSLSSPEWAGMSSTPPYSPGEQCRAISGSRSPVARA